MLKQAWRSFITSAFHSLYNRLAFTYDAVSEIVSLGQWRCWQRSVFQFIPAPDQVTYVLELAHGTGNLQQDFYARGYQSIGVDLSPNMGAIARRKLAKLGIHPALFRGSVFQLPLATASVPCVVCTFPTNFVLDPQFLQEAHRILTPSGQITIVLNGILTGGGLLAKTLELLYKITGQREPEHWEPHHYFASFGFHAELAEVTCKHSLVQLLILKKSD